jgi:hypothetical protein
MAHHEPTSTSHLLCIIGTTVVASKLLTFTRRPQQWQAEARSIDLKKKAIARWGDSTQETHGRSIITIMLLVPSEIMCMKMCGSSLHSSKKVCVVNLYEGRSQLSAGGCPGLSDPILVCATMLHLRTTSTERPYELTTGKQNMKTWPDFLASKPEINQPTTYMSLRIVFIAPPRP